VKDRREFLKSLGLAAATAAAAPMAGAEGIRMGRRRAGKPNVILIVSDEHQANTCGCYGSKVRQVGGKSPTPYIDALAREGVRFDSMYCASPLCAPSRAAYMTGMYPHSTTALFHKMQRREAGLSRQPGVKEGIPGMGQYFREAGYATAAFGKMHVHGEEARGWDLGFDERDLRFYTRAPGMHYGDLKDGDVNRRYREIPPYTKREYKKIDPVRFSGAPDGLTVKENGVNQHFLETLVEDEDEMMDHLVTERSMDFIRRKSAAGDSFLVHVGLEKPHRPWTIHRKFLDRFNPDDMPLPETVAEWLEKGMHPFVQGWSHSPVKGDEARNSTAAYYACASQVDDCVGRIMETCRELGILDNTIVIYTSDHGENLYEHGLIEKHNMLDPAARVPFIIRAPWALPQNAVCGSAASLIDMIPTLCEMTAIASSPLLEGESLLPAAAGKADPKRMVFSEFYQEGSCTRREEFLPVRMGLNQEFKYIYTHAAADQLYDRRTDGEDKGNNLAFDPANEAMVSHLKLCTLDGWELDEYPQLAASARVAENEIRLNWEPAAEGARYDVYRSSGSDPRTAERVAAGLAECSWIDGTPTYGGTASYWILGHYHLDRPYIDPRGKSRYGMQPILSTEYPRSLPVTRRLEVRLEQGFNRDFKYEPLLGCTFGGFDWIRIGMAPVTDGAETRLRGPVTILSPKPVHGAFAFSAQVCTPRPGTKPADTLQLIFNYQGMNRYYAVCLQRDGEVGLYKRTGEWAFDLLDSAPAKGARPGDWHELGIRSEAGSVAVLLDGREILNFSDPDPLPGGRCGFDAPLHLTDTRIQAVTLS
jgi:choline-sulfatase